MHRVLNIKHRIVRRIDVGKAPLATFDTIDLDDGEKVLTTKKERGEIKSTDNASDKDNIINNYNNNNNPDKSPHQEPQKPGTIGGNNSKKSLSHAGGGKDEKKNVESPDIAGDGNKENPDETGIPAPLSTHPPHSPALSPGKDAQTETDRSSTNGPTLGTDVVATDEVKEEEVVAASSCSVAKKPSPTCSGQRLNRQGTLGRVNIPIRKQDSVSSSSSSEACNDTNFTFTATRPSIAHLDSADAGSNLAGFFKDKNTVLGLIPQEVDPSQILSPSKRKAYEKRIERLKVTTSPIARPRSTAPISVVTLEEYATFSSPEASPASPSVLHDKLKITLPLDEFHTKPKTPKHLSAKRRDSEEASFEFTEEILFRCTKSALVVEEDGHLPLSPRRVLIPPTITPATSPKLSASPRLDKDSRTEDTVPLSATPKLIYFKEDVTAQTFFGKTVDKTEDENWADFPDSSQTNFEKENLGYLEKEIERGLQSREKSFGEGQLVTAAADTEEGSSLEKGACDSDDGKELSIIPADVSLPFEDPKLKSNDDLVSKVEDTSDENDSNDLPLEDSKIQTSYNIKENSEDVLVLEIIQHDSDADKTDSDTEKHTEIDTDLVVNESSTTQHSFQEKRSSANNLEDPPLSPTREKEHFQTFLDNTVSSTNEQILSDVDTPEIISGNTDLLGQSSLPLLDLRKPISFTAETNPFLPHTSPHDVSTAASDSYRQSNNPFIACPLDLSSATFDSNQGINDASVENFSTVLPTQSDDSTTGSSSKDLGLISPFTVSNSNSNSSNTDGLFLTDSLPIGTDQAQTDIVTASLSSSPFHIDQLPDSRDSKSQVPPSPLPDLSLPLPPSSPSDLISFTLSQDGEDAAVEIE